MPCQLFTGQQFVLESSWNVMAHGDSREGKWRRNWRMEWVASTLHTTSEHGVSSITTADAHTSAASSRLNWRHHQFNWTRPFRRKTKSGFCACAVTFQTQSASWYHRQIFFFAGQLRGSQRKPNSAALKSEAKRHSENSEQIYRTRTRYSIIWSIFIFSHVQ